MKDDLIVGHGQSNVRGPLSIKETANLFGATVKSPDSLRAEGAAAERARLREGAEERARIALVSKSMYAAFSGPEIADIASRVVAAIFDEGRTP